MHPRRRHDDVQLDVEVAEVEKFFESLPKTVKRLRWGRWQNLAVALFTLVSLLTISWNQEKAADQDRQDAYQQCRLVNDNALTINQFLDAQIQSLRMSRLLTDDEKKQRIHALAPLKQKLPVCRRP